MTVSRTRSGLALLGLTVSAVVGAQTVAPPKSLPSRASSAGAESGTGRFGAVAFSPDGKRLAVGGYQVVTLFDAATRRVLRRLPGPAGQVTNVLFSPDGNLLAAAGGLPGRAGEIVLWKAANGALLARIQPQKDVLYGLAFSPDSRRLATGSYDQTVALITPQKTLKPVLLKDHTDSVYAVAFSPDGTRLASVAGDRTVKVWDAKTGKRLYTLTDSTAELYTVAFHPNGQQLAAGGVDKTLRVWNLSANDGALARAAFAHEGAILRVAYAPDGQTLFTAGEDRAVKQWDAVTLEERRVFPPQSDWPQGLAIQPDGRRLAVSGYDGSLTLYTLEARGRGPVARKKSPSVSQNSSPSALRPARDAIQNPKSKIQTPDARAAKSGGPTLTLASLSGMAPTGAVRGQTVTFTLTGSRIHDATGVFFDDPAITGQIETPRETEAARLRVKVRLGETARIGVHRLWAQTPHGTTNSLSFAVGGWPEIAEAKSAETPSRALLQMPCTVVGKLESAGERDRYPFEAQAGDELVFEVIAQPLRSRLQSILTLYDEAGIALAESRSTPRRPDALLGYRFTKAGRYTLELRDAQNAMGADVHYRLNAGAFPLVTRAFPPGLQRGATTDIHLEGYNLPGKTIRVTAPEQIVWGQTMPIDLTSRPPSQFAIVAATTHDPSRPTRSLPGKGGNEFSEPLGGVRLAVGEDPEVIQRPGNDAPERAQPISTPATINGRLENHAPNAYFRFKAKKSQKLILEVMARRLGSPLDPEIAVLDTRGRPVPRALLRAVGQTELTLSDRDSASAGMRLVAWNDFRIHDYLLAGREVIRIRGLPKGPDDDVLFWNWRGQRLGQFGTTPEFHSVGSPVYKVEVHPPDRKFSPNGMPQTLLTYQNDDGGPLFGKDSYLEFTAPTDGEYLVRLRDTRGQGGQDYFYRLQIHPPRPDFRVSMDPAHPNLPQGGGAIVEVACERYDGFDGPISVALEGLPPGFTATSTTIEPGEMFATLLITVAPGAMTPSLPYATPIRLVAKAHVGGKERVRVVEPENGVRLLTVLPAPDLTIVTDRQEVTLVPGAEVTIEARVARRGEFGNRVPIDVRNLPFGVRVNDVGLNGVLITEEETTRQFTLTCEPWVQPQTRPIYVLGNVEGGVANAAPPLRLRIVPRR